MSNEQTQDIRRGWTSASNAEADLLCGARHLSQRGVPEPPKSKEADSGQRIHQALATAHDVQKALLDTFTVAEREVFDACREIEKREVLKFFEGHVFNPEHPLKVVRHQRYWVKVPDGNGGYYEHSGEVDVAYVHDEDALIADYKTLVGDVPEASSNLQLRDLGVLLRGNHLFVNRVGTLIIQPLVTHSPEVCVYRAEHLLQAEQEMFDRVRVSNTPGNQPVAGQKQCTFCRAKMACSAYQQWAGSMVPGMLTILDVPVSAWTPAQRAIFCEQRLVAQKWLDNCKDEIERLLSVDPEAVVGWYLKPGNKVEKIHDPQMVFDKFSQLGGTVQQFMACISVGKSKLKDVLAKVTGAKGKSLDAAIKSVVDGAVTITQNKPSLCKKDEQAAGESEP